MVYWKLFQTNISLLADTHPTNGNNEPTIVYLSLRFHKLIQLVSKFINLCLDRRRSAVWSSDNEIHYHA